MRVLVFGTYQRDYPRNAQVRSCLAGAGVEVVERHVPVLDDQRDAWLAGARTVARLAVAELRLAARSVGDADVVLVGYPGHLDVAAARWAGRGVPLVFDPLVSLSDTFVADRRRFAPGSLAARALRAIDRRALHAASVVVADTQAHASFYRDEFGVPETRLRVCFVGAEDRFFSPRESSPAEFHALFVGKLIPLHGLETIVAAARLVPDVPFLIVGSGQLGPQLDRALPANVTHMPWIPYERLGEAIRAAGCALGVFGSSDKAARVIPNKAYQALASAVPLITADTPAARELLHHGDDSLLVPAGDPAALAEAVRLLAGDPGLASAIGSAGRTVYEREASEAALGQRWRRLLEEVTA